MTQPTWQGDLFRPQCARNLAQQGELFPHDVHQQRPSKPKPDAPGQLTFDSIHEAEASGQCFPDDD